MLRDLELFHILNEAADNTNDARDHDELHAAAQIILTVPRWRESHYINRWIHEHIARLT